MRKLFLASVAILAIGVSSAAAQSIGLYGATGSTSASSGHITNLSSGVGSGAFGFGIAGGTASAGSIGSGSAVAGNSCNVAGCTSSAAHTGSLNVGSNSVNGAFGLAGSLGGASATGVSENVGLATTSHGVIGLGLTP